MKTKITLSIEEEVIEKAKKYVEKNNTSVSALVTRFLEGITSENQNLSPVTRSLVGVLPADCDPEKMRLDALEEKYLG